jgi:hypothetical protein
MATWIAHLRIAEGLLARVQGLEAAQFAIGNVAPDSGIPEDEERTKFNPPVQVTHFQNPDSPTRDPADLDFYRRCLRDVDPVSDALRFSFRFGYFCHLVTDGLWSLKVGRKTKARFPKEFAADPNFIWTVKDNWYGLDFLYARSHPDCLFWRVFLDAQPVAADLDFLPAEALTQQLAYIKEYYQRRDPDIETMIQTPYIYFTQSEMDAFINETLDDLQRLHRLIWHETAATDGFDSALKLLY